MSSATLIGVSVARGVFNPLVGKLTKLLGEEYKKLTGVKKQATFLRDELSAMKALLDTMELMDKLDPSAKNWRDRIREMSYDMENCIDDIMLNIEGADAKTGFLKKMSKRLRRLGKRHQIAKRIEELKVLAVDANDRRERYKIQDRIDLSPAVVVVDPRISMIYNDGASLVGIDGPKEELVSLLMDLQEKVKVVSIVGFGGLGKTTLAKQVYDEIGGQFNCKAFLSVSQRPDVKSLLIGLQRKLGMEESSHAHDMTEIIDRLIEYLTHKRYIIIVDDLWDQVSWNNIRGAFPENGNESRVVVTTRLDDVARWACHPDRACVYRMKPLEESDSRRLFFSRVFGSQNVCQPQFQEVSAEILKKCGGMPLAILTMASLLANHEARSPSEWKSIMNSLRPNVATETTLDELRGILNLSYMHLPICLRPCFLYLGMYHEDHEIEKDDLIQQWIAEGLFPNLNITDSIDVAKRRFNELINRSLIQPERTIYGEVRSCRVHDMILDLILSKSAEDNFMSVAYKYEDMARLHSGEYKVRRLSFKSSAGCVTPKTLATSMSEVRSYAQFGESTYTPPLTQFKYLRVLLFEFSDQCGTAVDLTTIGHLFLLRYLKVLGESTDVTLPAEIQGLMHLETLELVCLSTQSFPLDITCLANLFRLVLPYGRVLPQGIQNMKSVCTLHCSGISESSLEDIKGLSELTNLEELKLSSSQCMTVDRVDALVSSIGTLRKLKHLVLDCESECDGYDTQLHSLADPPPLIEVLDLERWRWSRLPKWIGELRNLRILSLNVLHLTNNEVRVLGELPGLVSVCFRKFDISQDNVMVGAGLFPNLEYFFFQCGDISEHLGFEKGAMPKILGSPSMH